MSAAFIASDLIVTMRRTDPWQQSLSPTGRCPFRICAMVAWLVLKQPILNTSWRAAVFPFF